MTHSASVIIIKQARDRRVDGDIERRERERTRGRERELEIVKES